MSSNTFRMILVFLLAEVIAIFPVLIATNSIAMEPLDSLRCGTHIVQPGETRLQVQDQCGLPDSKSAYDSYGHYGKFGELAGQYIERWTYNRGPEDYIYSLTFANGRLDEIERMDRGF